MKNGFRVMDCDRHIMEPPEIWDQYLEPAYRGQGPLYPPFSGAPPQWDGLPNLNPRGDRVSRGMDANPRWRAVYYEAMVQGFDGPSYLKDMDREGVDVAVCYPTVGLYSIWRDDMPAGRAAAVSRAYNNWLHDFCATDSNRLKAVGMLPLHDLDLAIKEAERAVRDCGLVGFFFRPNPVKGRRLEDAEYDRFFAAIADLDVPLCFHEGALTSLPQARLPYEPSNSYGRHICCHPMEQMLGLLSMCALGIFERHPKLRAGFFESGASWLPAWLDRLDRLWENPLLRAESPIKEKPSYYFMRQGLISGEGHEDLLPAIVRLYGDGVAMWASDYPHPDEVDVYPYPADPLVNDERLPTEVRQKILWDNPLRLYGMTAPALTEPVGSAR